MNHRIARLAAAFGVCALVLAPATLAAAHNVRVGPNQTFIGLVNGHGGGTAPSTVQTDCIGPVRPGQMGHPLAGQTIGISLGSGVIANVGHTGNVATSIVAFFGAPPPATSSNNTVRFLRYTTKPLPRRVRVPCSGAGKIYFVPLPMDPGSSQPATVAVNYEGQP